MAERSFASRFAGLPLGHKVIALLLAAGIAGGGHLWLQRGAELSGNAAQLTFDAVDGRSIDSGLATIHDPAVVLAQSVLTDSVVEQLSASAPLASTSLPSRLGEFRSHLQLTQTSGSTLNVRFVGADNAPSNATADIVAHAIAKSAFSAYGAPLVPAPAAEKTAPAPHAPAPREPAKSAAAPQLSQNSSALAGSLGDLDTLLSSTKRDLDKIAFAGAGGHQPTDPARYRESDQQHLLRARVAAAERKIGQIRSSGAAKDLPRAAAGQLAEIQHAVASILSAGHAGAHGYRSAGVDASQIRRERSQLDDAIATVHRDRLALQQAVGDQAAGDTDSSTSAPAATASTTDLPPQQETAPAAQAPASGDLLPNPFTFAHNAAAPSPTSWWPTVAAGLICGLLYWTFAALPDRELNYGLQDAPEPFYTGHNLITPAMSLSPRQEPEAAPEAAPRTAPAPLSQTREEGDLEGRSRRSAFRFEPAGPEVAPPAPVAAHPEPAPEDISASREEGDLEGRSRRAAFRFEPAGPEVAPPAPVAAHPEPAPEEVSASQDVESPEELSSPQSVASPPHAAAEAAAESETQWPSLPEAHFLAPSVIRRPQETQEKPIPDPWIRDIRRGLEQSGFGRRFQNKTGAEASAEHDKDGEQHPARTDDLAS